jgi:hypothetical protein
MLRAAGPPVDFRIWAIVMPRVSFVKKEMNKNTDKPENNE